ncbi:hypothetical protein ACHQM5_009491 [Ranunculus cassubicifolius]
MLGYFLLAIIFLYLPNSLCYDDFRWSNCTSTFQCGNIKEIGYPFWGGTRPEYCGHPDFELQCHGNVAQIQIQSEKYRVLHIDSSKETLRLSTQNNWSGNCPSKFLNNSIPSSNSFKYSTPFTQDVDLFYNCPALPLFNTNRFTCSLNTTTDSYNYYWIDSMEKTLRPRDLLRCNVSVSVPVLQTVMRNFTRSESSVEEIVNKGFDVRCLSNISECNSCMASSGGCGYNSSSGAQICFCLGGDVGNEHLLCPAVFSVLAAVVLLIILIATCCWKKRHVFIQCINFWKRKKRAQMMVENFLNNYGSFAPKRYKYSGIKKITRSFKDKIGQGGYGVVYKGKLVDGTLVAVKLLDKGKDDGEEFINEVESFSRTSHVNIVSLLGFCYDGFKRALIYEYMVNGSLEKFIYDHNPLVIESQLGWEKLNQIVIGVARGLEYLHRGCNTRILHFDIKPHNILLDKDFIPKISDFGLAKVCTTQESVVSMSGTRGTAGYIAPEVFSRNFGGVSHKSDVYSYGMMVLEIVGMKKNRNVATNDSSDVYFPQWIYKRLEMDEDLGLQGVVSSEEENITRKMILVALWCIQTNPVDRPAMRKVVEMLEGKLELLSIPPQPCLSSPPRDAVSSSYSSLAPREEDVTF